MQVREVGRALSIRQRYLGGRVSWKVLRRGVNPLVLYSEACAASRMKDGRDWVHGDQAEDEGPVKSCYRYRGRAHGARIRPGAVGERGGWVGEERQPENR